MATYCPSPAKPRYATRRVARDAADEAEERRSVYMCACGWFHLTSETTADDYDVEPEEVARLRNLDGEEFAKIASLELEGNASMPTAAALRTPALFDRWNAFLSDLDVRLQAHFTNPDAPVGRHRLHILRTQVTARKNEIKVMRSDIHLGRKKANEERAELRAQATSLRSAAGEAALRRLRDAHLQEYDKLFAEELERLTDKPSQD